MVKDGLFTVWERGSRSQWGYQRGLTLEVCKGCGHQSVLDKPRGVDAGVKRQAVQLYLEGMGFRAIGRILGVSNVSVLKWIRALGEKVEELRKTKTEPSPNFLSKYIHITNRTLQNYEDAVKGKK